MEGGGRHSYLLAVGREEGEVRNGQGERIVTNLRNRLSKKGECPGGRSQEKGQRAKLRRRELYRAYGYEGKTEACQIGGEKAGLHERVESVRGMLPGRGSGPGCNQKHH